MYVLSNINVLSNIKLRSFTLLENTENVSFYMLKRSEKARSFTPKSWNNLGLDILR